MTGRCGDAKRENERRQGPVVWQRPLVLIMRRRFGSLSFGYAQFFPPARMA